MKKIILASIISVSLFSCSNQTDVAREKIEDHIDSFANDPGSYQFVRMEKPDTMRRSDTLMLDSFLLDHYKDRVADDQDQVDWYQERVQGSYGYIYQNSYDFYLKCLADSKERLNKVISKLESEKELYNRINNTEMDSILRITHKLSFRIKNAAGGLMLTSARITFTPSNQSWGSIKIKNPLKD